MAAEEFAPAKVNLSLHVTGQAEDGRHWLDSLVVFAGIGDRLSAERAPDLSLTVSGPFAAALDDETDNLVFRAARLLGDQGAAITLIKNLPVAAGIGGGSSDAAAALRLLSRMWGKSLPAIDVLMRLGADVPVCLEPFPHRMRGKGEVLERVELFAPAWLVLVNPGVRVATAMVFTALSNRQGTPMPARLPRWTTVSSFADFLRHQRNDLEKPACTIAPVILDVLAAIGAQRGCLLARMSGSGATCFGLFDNSTLADNAAAALGKLGWWTTASPVLPT